MVGEVAGLFALPVIDPDIVGHAAAVAFPCSEFAEDAVIGEPVAVWREGGEAAAREGKLFRHSAVDRGQIELSFKVIELAHARAEKDLLAVGSPTHDDGVGSHAVGDLITIEGGGPGQAPGHAALGGD